MAAPTREEAWELFCQWTESDSLRRHVLGVEAAMRAYARKYGEDEELWAATGILHDLDYERHPDLESGHPRVALELFEQRGYPPELIDAVAGHAPYLGVPRESRLSRTLFAVDELTGFLAAVALVRPTGIAGLTPKSVKKKMKQPSFAAAISREDLRLGAEELGEDLDQHIAFVIAALEPRAEELGLTGGAVAHARLDKGMGPLGVALHLAMLLEGVDFARGASIGWLNGAMSDTTIDDMIERFDRALARLERHGLLPAPTKGSADGLAQEQA